MTKYKPGDLVSVDNYWDQGEEVFESGIMLIEGHHEHPHTEYGVYEVNCLSGTIAFVYINASVFDKLTCTTYLGNINEDNALRVLYGRNS